MSGIMWGYCGSGLGGRSETEFLGWGPKRSLGPRKSPAQSQNLLRMIPKKSCFSGDSRTLLPQIGDVPRLRNSVVYLCLTLSKPPCSVLANEPNVLNGPSVRIMLRIMLL